MSKLSERVKSLMEENTYESPLKHREDHELIPDVHAAAFRGPHKFASGLLIVIGTMLAVFIGWAALAELDEVTRGDGKVIPSGKVQVAQHFEGGVVEEILVREGAIVEKDQVLLRINNTNAEAEYQENLSRSWSLKGAIARLKAESSGKKLVMPAEVTAKAPEVARRETELYDSRKAKMSADIDGLESKVQQARQSLLEARSTASALGAQTASLSREVARMQDALSKGVVSEIEVIRLKRERTRTAGEYRTAKPAIPRAQAALREAQEAKRSGEATLRAEARRELSQAEAELAVIAEKLKGGVQRVTRSEVKAPVRGTVKQINVNTVGGTVKPGEDLVEIVPLEDSLLIEAKIRPADIGQLRLGLPAVVKISAYDFSIYGGLEGKVERISADAIEDENKRGESFFRITVRTDKTYLGTKDNPQSIIPGMTASVDIKTGKKTVLAYIMKPILKAKNEALRER